MKDCHTFILFISCCSIYAVVCLCPLEDVELVDCRLTIAKGRLIYEDDYNETIITIVLKRNLTNLNIEFFPISQMFTFNEEKNKVHFLQGVIAKREEAYSFTLLLKYDGTKSCIHTCWVRVLVVNRYEPEFNITAVRNIFVEENRRFPEALLTVEASDKDYPRSYHAMKKINFTLQGRQSSEDTSPFELKYTRNDYGLYTVQLFLTNTLDFEARNVYMLSIIAEDESKARENPTPTKTTSIDIYVFVKDVHDQPPRFINECGLTKLEGHIAAGTEITTLEARDQDNTIGNPVKYSMIYTESACRRRCTIEKYFKINRKTGKLTIKESFGRENEDLKDLCFISFRIKATEYNKKTGRKENVNATAITTCVIQL